jgi:hypothetical protein
MERYFLSAFFQNHAGVSHPVSGVRREGNSIDGPARFMKRLDILSSTGARLSILENISIIISII